MMRDNKIAAAIVWYITTVHTVLSRADVCDHGVRFNPVPTWPEKFNYVAHGIDYLDLKCFVDQSVAADFNVTWTKDNQTINSGNVAYMNQNQEMMMDDLDVSDSGTYRCTASNRHGTCSYENYINIIDSSGPVYKGPSILDRDGRKVDVVLGSTAHISCTIYSGSIALVLQSRWLRNGKLLNDTTKHEWNITEEEKSRQKLSLTIRNISVEDLGEYSCFSENDFGNDTKKIWLQQEKNDDKSHSLPLWQIGLIAVGGLVFVAMVIVPTVCYKVKQRKETVNWLKPDPENYDVPDYKLEYDVFISYSSGDEQWVKDELFKYLHGQGYTVNIDFKDFVPGMAIAENIIDATYKSKKTIVVMSRNFLRSMWGQFELQQAHNRAIAQRKDVLILIKYDKCKVPTKLMGKTFLDWTSTDVKPHFWQRLTEAIGEPQKFEELNQFFEQKLKNNEEKELQDKTEDTNEQDISGVVKNEKDTETVYKEGEITLDENSKEEMILRVKDAKLKVIDADYGDEDLAGLRISQEERMQLIM